MLFFCFCNATIICYFCYHFAFCNYRSNFFIRKLKERGKNRKNFF